MLVRAAAALLALVLATTPSVAVPQGPQASSFETFVRFIRNTDPGSNPGMPGLTIPAGLGPTTGLPVGVSLDGLPDSDDASARGRPGHRAGARAHAAAVEALANGRCVHARDARLAPRDRRPLSGTC